MKTLLRILIILINLLIPFLAPIALVVVCFFVYGSGSQGSEELQKQMYIWIGIYIIIGLIHLFLVYNYLKFLPEKQKTILYILLALQYLYFGFNYMA